MTRAILGRQHQSPDPLANILEAVISAEIGPHGAHSPAYIEATFLNLLQYGTTMQRPMLIQSLMHRP